MKIIRLLAENVKRLHAVEITPEGAVIKIAGKNGAGKTSVLDSISYALGGASLVPAQPIRSGETDARVVIDIGDFVVTRKFSRDRIHEDTCDLKKPPHEVGTTPVCNCKVTFGPTKSSLIVKNREGASYPSPQAILDKLLGKLTFDPLQFARAAAKEQDTTLRQLVGLDVTPFENARRAAAERRSVYKKQAALAEAKLTQMSSYQGLPATEVSTSEVSAEILRAEELRQLATEAEQAVGASGSRLLTVEGQASAKRARIEELEKQVAKHREELASLERQFQHEQGNMKALSEAAEAARKEVPNVNVIRQKLIDIEEKNTKIKANNAYGEVRAECIRLNDQVASAEEAVKKADEDKRAALEAVKFPVAGLGFSDDMGVTFNSVPFEQASNAEQIRVSVAIGLALNPKLRVLLIRNGNGLDSTSLQLLTKQAEQAEAQVWMEWVAESKEGVAVMLEDGEVV